MKSTILILVCLFGLFSCKQNPCKNKTCQNSGKPTQISNRCDCTCQLGFSGVNCEIVDPILKGHYGSYKATGNNIKSEVANVDHDYSINTDNIYLETSVSCLTLIPMFNFRFNINVVGNSFTIPTQTVSYSSGSTNIDDQATTSIFGNGTLNVINNKVEININYTLHVIKSNGVFMCEDKFKALLVEN